VYKVDDTRGLLLNPSWLGDARQVGGKPASRAAFAKEGGEVMSAIEKIFQMLLEDLDLIPEEKLPPEKLWPYNPRWDLEMDRRNALIEAARKEIGRPETAGDSLG
jgi:hypothetical protein